METRANYALIGAFTLAVVAGAFAFVVWFSGGAKRLAVKDYRLVFTSSVSGLSPGSMVTFNGLRVGEVKSVELGDDPSQVVALIEVADRTPVKTDTRARLEYQGLTGVASVALSGGSADAPALDGPLSHPPTIAAERSEYQNIVQSLQSLSTKTDEILDKANKLIGQNQASINETVNNIQKFTKALGDNSSGINDFLAGMADLGRTIRPLSKRLEVLTADLDTLVKAVDPDKVKSIVNGADQFTQALAGNKQNIDELLSESAKAAKSLQATTTKLDSLLDNANQIATAIDPKKVGSTVDDLSAFAATLDKNRATTDQILQNAQALTAKLNASADKIDGVLASAQGFLGQPGTKSTFDKVADAAEAIRKLADHLDQRTKEIAQNLNRFSGAGLRDYQVLATKGQQTLDELNRTVRSLQKNPQQVIFGARPQIPEYGGR